jgi:pimeloyl-ACP methyl ester carboxylesterase
VKRIRWAVGLTSLGVGAAITGALVAGNRFLDRWQNLKAEEVAEGEFCTLSNGWRIHFVSKGQGSPVVLLHGFMDSLQSWRGNVGALAERHRVIALDTPGFGCSERVTQPVYSLKRQARVLGEFFDLQGIERAALVGHSLGGALAAQFAYDFPERVDRLVLEDAAVYLRVPRAGGLLSWVPPFIPRGALGLYSMNPTAIRTSLKNAYGDGSRLDDESVKLRARALRVHGTAEALVSMLESPRDSDLPGAVYKLDVPTLIIWGERDRVIPLAHGRRLQRDLPKARLAIIAEAGHLPHEEFPNKVNQLLNSFLDC